eukprot:COSAG06_NODE_4235_length_4443_cov_194.471915_7_plen_230_part_00
MPALEMRSLAFEQPTDDSWLPPTLLLEFTAADKKTKVRLADYGSLGLRGQHFQTWLTFGTVPSHAMPKNIPKVVFSKENPTRTFFVADVPPPPAEEEDQDEDEDGGSGQNDHDTDDDIGAVMPAAAAAPASTATTVEVACAAAPAGVLSIKLLGSSNIPSRRTRIALETSLLQLRDALSLPHATKLEYLDDEGDWVVLQTEADLAEAKRSAAGGVMYSQGGLLKLRVHV